ncbi:5-(carboxyamino)imidazole ribonucleotide mutase [Filifactor villosus]|uniref:N5-carboxyaminoimidazole ribonucleotide mutase n=1 Tax=Filifactor villosus TaxID=29374 RepID=A0ABV9QKN5_9FIRM
MKVAIVMGSVSDFDKVKDACEFLNKMEVDFEIRALSAHRTARELELFMEENDRHIDVYIAAAGKAAHLPGVIASKTCKPVIGIPIKSSALEGMDALLSIVQMPPGVPVATVAINGSKNAAILACQMMSLKYDELSEKMVAFKKNMEEETLEKEREFLKNF